MCLIIYIFIQSFFFNKSKQTTFELHCKDKYIELKEFFPIIYFDSTFWQNDVITKEFRNIENQYNIRLPYRGIKETRNKVQKIESLQTYWFQRILFFNKNIEKTIDWQEFKNELTNWNSTTHTVHDDALDSLISSIYLMPLGSVNSSTNNKPLFNMNEDFKY